MAWYETEILLRTVNFIQSYIYMQGPRCTDRDIRVTFHEAVTTPLKYARNIKLNVRFGSVDHLFIMLVYG